LEIKMKLIKKTLLAAVLVAPLIAQAAPLTMDTTVFGGTVVSGITNLDWSPTSVLADGGNVAFTNFLNGGAAACTTGACDFTVYSHGRLGNFNNAANNPILGTGLNTAFEITYQLAFSEHVTSAVGVPGTTLATFGFGNADGTVGTNFFRLFISPVNSNDLAGTLFGDGTNILAGTIAPAGGYLSLFGATGGPVPIGGQSGITPAAWAGQTTVTGTGTTSTLDLLSVAPTVLLGSVFTNGLSSFLLDNLSTTLPFTATDLSLLFEEDGNFVTSGPGGIGNPNGAIVALPSGGFAPVGNSIAFQTDANSPVSGTVPEPGTLALAGLAITLGGMAGRRRKQQS